MRKIDPLPTLNFQLATLHRNLKPRLQQLIRRKNFEDVETLLNLAMEVELALEAEKLYKSRPPPETCVYSDLLPTNRRKRRQPDLRSSP